MGAFTPPGGVNDGASDLAESVRVISAHLQIDVGAGRARDEIRHTAVCLEAGMAGPSLRSLAARLEKATGCTIDELAARAEQWHD